MENESASGLSMVRKSSPRVRGSASSSALFVICVLALLVGVGGFAWGMWEEVGAAPRKYAALNPESDMTRVKKWSVFASSFILKLQNKKLPWEDVGVSDNVTSPPDDSHVTPEPKEPSRHESPTADTHPKKSEPTSRKVDHPKPVRREPKLSPGIRDLVHQADKAWETGCKYHQKAQPNAPARGRAAALKKAIKYLRQAQKLYHTVLQHKPPKATYEQVEQRLTDVQRRLFWAYKFSGIK